MEGYTGDIFWNGGNNNGAPWNGGWWQDNWNGGGGWGGGGPMPPPPGQWNNTLVPKCPDNVRNKFSSQMRGASLNFIGAPSLKQAGAFVMVEWKCQRARQPGRMGQIAYHCTMHPNGNVADSSYNVTQSPGTPQPG